MIKVKKQVTKRSKFEMENEDAVSFIKPSWIKDMELVPDSSSNPALRVWVVGEDEVDEVEFTFDFPLCTAQEVVNANEFLRSLDLDVNLIEFKYYKQYSRLITYIMDLLRIKQEFESDREATTA